MPQDLTWDNAEEIGILLSQAHPEVTPLNLQFPDLQRYVTELAEFKGDATEADDRKLKAIQAAWQEEFQDRTQD
jgi:FeS assembly protein IscX